MALGRLPEFAPVVRRKTRKGRIEIRPHWDHEDNAYYEPDEAALCFGYVTSSGKSLGATQPGAYVFTCLSHDVIAHETAHAMLDGMRPHLMRPSNPDVAAFHEGFADLVALLMRFRYQDVVRRGLEDSKDQTLDSALLTEMAKQWGRTDGDGQSPLRQILYRQGPPDEPVPEDGPLRPEEGAPRPRRGARGGRVRGDEPDLQTRRPGRCARLPTQSPGARDHLIDLLTTRGARPGRPVPEHHHPRDRLLPAGRHHLRRVPPRAGHRRLGHGAGRSVRLSRGARSGVPPLRHHRARGAGSVRGGAALERAGGHAAAGRRPELRGPAPPVRAGLVRRSAGRTASSVPRRSGATSPATAATGTSASAARDARASCTTRCRSSSPIRTLRRLTPDDDLDFHIVAEVTQRVKKEPAMVHGRVDGRDRCRRHVRFVIGKGVANWDRHRQTDAFLAAVAAWSTGTHSSRTSGRLAR